MQKNISYLKNLQTKLIIKILEEIPHVSLNGHKDKRIPNNVHFTFFGVNGEDLIIKLDENGILINNRDVPLVFGHKNNFLTKIQKTNQYNKYLPMMSVIITDIARTSPKTRGCHLVELMKYFSGTEDSINKWFGGVPYTISYSFC